MEEDQLLKRIVYNGLAAVVVVIVSTMLVKQMLLPAVVYLWPVVQVFALLQIAFDYWRIELKEPRVLFRIMLVIQFIGLFIAGPVWLSKF